jgi:hypothetical protein
MSDTSASGTDHGKEWFAGIMWDEMPEDAKEQIRDGDCDE